MNVDKSSLVYTCLDTVRDWYEYGIAYTWCIVYIYDHLCILYPMGMRLYLCLCLCLWCLSMCRVFAFVQKGLVDFVSLCT